MVTFLFYFYFIFFYFFVLSWGTHGGLQGLAQQLLDD